MHHHDEVIKDADVEDEPDPISFEDWVTQHSDRIPSDVVDDSDAGYSERQRVLGEARRGVIRRSQARAEDSSVPVFSGVETESGSTSSSNARGSEGGETEETRFGLSDEEFNQLRAAWEEEWKQRMRDRREQARREGYQEGYEKARREADEQIAELETLLDEGLRELEREWASFFEHVDRDLADLSVQIAERILDAPLPHEMHDRVKSAIHDAVDELAGETRTDVTLHPADYLRMQESGLMEQLETAYDHLQWHSDPDLEFQGNWIVESPQGALRHLKEELLHEIATSLGLHGEGTDPDLPSDES